MVDSEQFNKMGWSQDIVDRFWNNVNFPEDVNNCWEWKTQSNYWGGYYQFYIENGKQIRITKFSYEYFNGPLLKKTIIFNTCNNKKCVNPNHLYTSDNEDEIFKRFVAKVDVPNDWEKFPEKCWEWTGGLLEDGYGCFSINGKSRSASRYIYEYYNGPILNGLLVCHTCDNPKCVNPNHLFLGTNNDNSKDMVVKNRSLKGSDCHLSILTEDIVMNMINDIWLGNVKSVKDVMIKYKTSDPNIRDILNGKTWLHVTNMSAIPLALIKEKIIRTFLDEDTVREIRKEISLGKSDKSIMLQFGLGRETVRSIRLRKSWKHVI